MSIKHILGWVAICVLLTSMAFADDEYKPYLHKAEVPEHPGVKLYGSYSTNIFPGAATYSYEIEVPPGTNGLQPSLSLSYNSQSVKQRPSFLGAGWTLPQNHVFRHVNFTPTNVSDDMFVLVLNGASYDLVFDSSDGFFHTEIETFARIQNLSSSNNENGMYWLVTLKDGTQLKFGDSSSSELVSGHGYVLKWSLDSIMDTFDNTISYFYVEDPYLNDNGSVYLDKITYNNDNKREVRFGYEGSDRPDQRLVYEQGNVLRESRRLADISIYFNESFLRGYSLEYNTLGSPETLSLLTSVSYIGNDNLSQLHEVSFDYYNSSNDYYNETDTLSPMLFTNYFGSERGVRIADFNNDGFPDMAQAWEPADSEEMNFSYNNRGSWGELETIQLPDYFIDNSDYDKGTRLVDINNDGLLDMIKGRGGLQKAWLGNGVNFTETPKFAPPVDFITFHDTKWLDTGARLADINGDGRVDIVQSGNITNTNKVYLNTENGWQDVSGLWQLPVTISYSTIQDNGVRFIDVNSDGLTDIFRSYHTDASAEWETYLNTGSGWSLSNEWQPPVEFKTPSGRDRGARLADMNGDGLIDIVKDFANETTSERAAWVNTGNGWQRNDYWQAPKQFTTDGRNIGRRIVDMNGDGLIDILVADGYNGGRQTIMRNTSYPYLLKSITNEFGGTTHIFYERSTMMNNTGSDDISDLGFNIWVVGTELHNTGLEGDFELSSNTTYEYESGLFDYNDTEFRGFAAVNQTQSDDTKFRHYFHQGDYLKGKEYKTESYSADNSLISRSENTFAVSENQYGVRKVEMDSSSLHTFDGLENPIVTNVTFGYDDYSNVIEKVSHGYTSVSGDEKYEEYSFVYNDSTWILDKVREYRLLGADNSEVVRKSTYFYDNKETGVARGALTKQEDYLNTKETDSVSTYEYDSYGNVVRQVDPLGRVTTFEFGVNDLTNTFAERVTNDLGHVSEFVYDVGTGNMISQKKNGILTEFEYDTFGRILKEILPYDSSTLPTKSYTYTFDGTAPESIKIAQKTTSNKTLHTIYYYDGFANLVQMKSPSENNQQIVKNIFYDGLFRVAKEQNPYFDAATDSISSVSGTEPFTFYTYDSLGRIVQVTNPDGTRKQTLYTQNTIVDRDENNNFKTYVTDAYDRIVSVQEHNVDFYTGSNETYVTSYAYSPADELTSIEDHTGNNFNFTYDTLGRKVRLDDPDLGRWHYGYDYGGNLVNQTDAKGNQILITYDSLDRIIHKNTSVSSIAFTYDQDYQGTLASISFDNFTLLYEYDDRLRVLKEILREGSAEDGYRDYESSFMFDSADRLLSMTTPADEDLKYLYSAQGRVSEIRGYINETTYNAFGNPLNRSYFNNKITSFEYDVNTARLTEISTGADQDLDYSYDSVGNIVGIDDTVNSRTYRMSYDNLDRLTNVSINDYNWVYSYDALGNILKIVRNFSTTTSFKLGSLAHAPSTVVEMPTGVDVYAQDDVNTSTKSRVVQFFLVNEKDESLSQANWTADFGSGNVYSNQVFNLDKGENVLVIAEHDYSAGGMYSVSLGGSTAGVMSDTESLDIMFGALVNGLDIKSKNATVVVSEFNIKNSMSETSEGWSWRCDSVTSSVPFNMSADENMMVIVENEYLLSDDTIECEVDSDDGNQSATVLVEYDGLVINSYNLSVVDSNTVVIDFTVLNLFSSQNISWSITGADAVHSGGPTAVDQGLSLEVSQQLDFSSSGNKEIVLSVSSEDFETSYTQHFDVESVVLENFMNTVKNGTARVFNVLITNTNDKSADGSWNATTPNVGDNISLASNESLIVIVEEDFGQGLKTHSVQVFNTTHQDDFEIDRFLIKEVEVSEFDVVVEENDGIVVQSIVRNNQHPLNLSWELDTGDGMVSSSSAMELVTGEDAIVIVENSYSEDGVYPLNFRVHSSNYNDNTTGVAVND